MCARAILSIGIAFGLAFEGGWVFGAWVNRVSGLRDLGFGASGRGTQNIGTLSSLNNQNRVL